MVMTADKYRLRNPVIVLTLLCRHLRWHHLTFPLEFPLAIVASRHPGDIFQNRNWVANRSAKGKQTNDTKQGGVSLGIRGKQELRWKLWFHFHFHTLFVLFFLWPLLSSFVGRRSHLSEVRTELSDWRLAGWLPVDCFPCWEVCAAVVLVVVALPNWTGWLAGEPEGVPLLARSSFQGERHSRRGSRSSVVPLWQQLQRNALPATTDGAGNTQQRHSQPVHVRTF